MQKNEHRPLNRPPLRREPVHGVLWLDKPAGLTSTDALSRAKRALRAEKAGHGGTLDPMATGLLPLAFGEATKFLHDLLHADKAYEAVAQLGVVTSTGDAEGALLSEQVVPGEVAEGPGSIDATFSRFVGAQHQVPPMVSALKHQGRPLYELARAGIEIDRAPREVMIFSLDRLPAVWPRLAFRTKVSKGTYIRTLAQDIGQALGCGAHLVALRRIAVGTRALPAIELDALLELAERDLPAARALLEPVDALLQGLPRVDLDVALADRFMLGQRLATSELHACPSGNSHSNNSADSRRARVYCGPRLLGTAHLDSHRLAPERLVHLL